MMWYKKNSVQLQFTLTMWKYIVIVALALCAFASYVFYKTHTAMVTSTGEVAALRTQLDNAANKNKEVYMDECIAAYAQMRHEWLTERKAQADAERVRIEEETVRVKQEIENLQQDYENVGGNVQEEHEKLTNIVKEIANRDDLRELMEKMSLEAEDMSHSDPDLFSKIASNLHALDSVIEAMKEKTAMEQSTIESLVAQRDELNEDIAKEDTITRERRARISPIELECYVTMADPNWDYVIVDKGIDGGVVIGSRLVVLRGDRKICELSVTLVEENRSSCDVVYSTLKAGEAVHPGDRVIAVRPEVQQ